MFNKIKYKVGHKRIIEMIISITDQCFVSLSNFITGVITAKTLSPENFGTFTMLYTGLFVFSGFQNALITGPLRIFGIGSKNNEEYFRVQNQLQIILGTLISVLSAIVLAFIGLADKRIIIYYFICVFMFQLQELGRAIDLTRLRLTVLLKNDIITHTVRMLLFYVLLKFNILTINMTFIIIAASCCIGYIVRYDTNIFLTNSQAIKIISLQNLKYGKWLLLETIVYTLSTQAYIYITAILIDKKSAGALNAIQNILNPVNVIALGVMSYVIPIARIKLLEAGYDEWKKWMINTGGILLIFVVLILLLLSVFSQPLIRIIYSEYYTKYYLLIPVLSVCYFLIVLNGVLSSAFRTINMPQVGFYMKAISAVFTIIASYPLLKYLGIYGSAMGLLMTQLIWAIVSFALIAKGYMSKNYLELYNYKS